MIIYQTPFDPDTQKYIAPSEDSGFESIDQVIELMGEPIQAGKRIAIYEGLVFTDMVRAVDSSVNRA